MNATKQLPSFSSYCDNTTKGNALVFSLGDIDVYYSYKTPVAFHAGERLYVRENVWGPTTGKHLNAIDGGDKEAKAARVGENEFKVRLADALEGESAIYLVRDKDGASIVRGQRTDRYASGDGFDGYQSALAALETSGESFRYTDKRG